ncbi:MAG: hypothetical protein ACHP65_01560, partial [Legionellales bacterium]
SYTARLAVLVPSSLHTVPGVTILGNGRSNRSTIIPGEGPSPAGGRRDFARNNGRTIRPSISQNCPPSPEFKKVYFLLPY